MPDPTHVVTRRDPWPHLPIVLSFLGAQGAMLWPLLGPLIGQCWGQGFRNYFANNQLSYAAIDTKVAKRTFSPIEPLTEAGGGFNPSGW